MRSKLLISLAVAFTLSGCANTAPSINEGRTYRVHWLGSQPTLDESYLTLTFDSDDRAYGTGGCNHWFAGYGVEGEILRFSRIGSTHRNCSSEIMAQEQRLFELLGQVRRWDYSSTGDLRLWPEEGKPIRLRPDYE